MALTSVRECTGHRTIKTQCAPMSCIAVTVSSRIEGIPVYLRLRGVVLERKNSPGYTDKRLSSPTPGKWSCREKGRLRDNSSARDLMRTVTKMWLASQTQWRAPESKTGFVERCTQFSGSEYSVSCRVVGEATIRNAKVNSHTVLEVSSGRTGALVSGSHRCSKQSMSPHANLF